jgi:hypothetical protein
MKIDKNNKKLEIDRNNKKLEIDRNNKKLEIDKNNKKLEINENNKKLEINENNKKLEINENNKKLEINENNKKLEMDGNNKKLEIDKNNKKLKINENSIESKDVKLSNDDQIMVQGMIDELDETNRIELKNKKSMLVHFEDTFSSNFFTSEISHINRLKKYSDDHKYINLKKFLDNTELCENLLYKENFYIFNYKIHPDIRILTVLNGYKITVVDVNRYVIHYYEIIF